jgi:hypothetical protein
MDETAEAALKPGFQRRLSAAGQARSTIRQEMAIMAGMVANQRS